MSVAVLDTSAILAWLRGEPGDDQVHGVLSTAHMSSVNWSELSQKLHQHGTDARRTVARLRAFGVQVQPFDDTDAVRAAELWSVTRACGLSLGDRACLALAEKLDAPAYTADRSWKDLQGVELDIRLIR